MRIFLFFVCLLFGIHIYAQNLPLNEKGQIEFTDEIEASGLSQEELYDKALIWFQDKYTKKKKNEDILHTTNPQDGIIEASPLLWMFVHRLGQNTGGGSIIYDIKVETFDHKYVYHIYNLDHESNRSRFGSGGDLENELPECGEEEMPLAIWLEIKEKTKQQCEKILNDLNRYMNK